MLTVSLTARLESSHKSFLWKLSGWCSMICLETDNVISGPIRGLKKTHREETTYVEELWLKKIQYLLIWNTRVFYLCMPEGTSVVEHCSISAYVFVQWTHSCLVCSAALHVQASLFSSPPGPPLWPQGILFAPWGSRHLKTPKNRQRSTDWE